MLAVIKADEFQHICALGTENEVQTLQGLVAKRLHKICLHIAATLRYHCISATTGEIYDADGTRKLLDLYQRFNISQNIVNMALLEAGAKNPSAAENFRSQAPQ